MLNGNSVLDLLGRVFRLETYAHWFKPDGAYGVAITDGSENDYLYATDDNTSGGTILSVDAVIIWDDSSSGYDHFEADNTGTKKVLSATSGVITWEPETTVVGLPSGGGAYDILYGGQSSATWLTSTTGVLVYDANNLRWESDVSSGKYLASPDSGGNIEFRYVDPEELRTAGTVSTYAIFFGQDDGTVLREDLGSSAEIFWHDGTGGISTYTIPSDGQYIVDVSSGAITWTSMASYVNALSTYTTGGKNVWPSGTYVLALAGGTMYKVDLDKYAY